MSDEHGNPPNQDEVDAEAKALRLELCREYGWDKFALGALLSGITSGVHALAEAAGAQGGNDADYARQKVSEKIAKLFEIMVPNLIDRAAVITIARRLDSAIELWMLDDIEREMGLPEGGKLQYPKPPP